MKLLGMLSGTGSDASGNNLMTFTGVGWGYGLLLADEIETFLYCNCGQWRLTPTRGVLTNL